MHLRRPVSHSKSRCPHHALVSRAAEREKIVLTGRPGSRDHGLDGSRCATTGLRLGRAVSGAPRRRQHRHYQRSRSHRRRRRRRTHTRRVLRALTSPKTSPHDDQRSSALTCGPGGCANSACTEVQARSDVGGSPRRGRDRLGAALPLAVSPGFLDRLRRNLQQHPGGIASPAGAASPQPAPAARRRRFRHP